MSNYDPVIEPEQFAITLDEILKGIPIELLPGLQKAVRKSARKGRRSVKANARKAGFRLATSKGPSKTASTYIKGWSYRMKSNSDGAAAEIGNEEFPGLAHLLEKGHARVGGGRVQAYPHIKQAAQDAENVLVEEVLKAVDEL